MRAAAQLLHPCALAVARAGAELAVVTVSVLSLIPPSLLIPVHPPSDILSGTFYLSKYNQHSCLIISDNSRIRSLSRSVSAVVYAIS